MKKISKITLENFRAFSGKKEISFNNHDENPADFICIYGKNGFGKTSLFDGFEWFFTGEIHLLEKELQSNILRYNGNILKNKYSYINESSGINIEFSDGEQGRKTVVQRSSSINDYGKGRPSGTYKNMVNKKQILPHSKIDSFVYASKPTQMYEEWGNFWDPDNIQRNKFKSIYNVYKAIDKENKNSKDRLDMLSKELLDLDINSKVTEFNKRVSEFNKIAISGIGNLELLQYFENQKIDSENILLGEKLLEPLKKLSLEYSYLSNQCKFLEKHFKEYKYIKQYQEDMFYKKKRWEAIIVKCNEKKNFLEKKELLISKINKIKEDKDNIVNTFNEDWFKEYEKYIEIQTKYKKINDDIQNNDLKIHTLNKKIQLINETKNLYNSRLKSLSDSYTEWNIKLQELELQEKAILDENICKKVNEKKNEVEKK